MKILLKDFQIDVVNNFVEELHLAGGEAQRRRLQAVSLSSPTGSGKTVMATAAIERLFTGDDEYPANPHVTVLWITDQPELNEQTRRKMLAMSTELGPSRIEVIEAGSFDQETFTPGRVYFLNTQKLGKESNLVKGGDKRTYTIWDTVRRTVEERPGSFYVFIDEAHRGMAQSTQARNEARTIIQRFIKGWDDAQLPPVPLIVGISATPERFHTLVQGISRTARPVEVSPEAVRESGLIKEYITFWHPKESQPSDMTMLRSAARSWKTYGERWAAYCAQQNEPMVRPLLTVQVQDGSGKLISQTDIAAAIAAVEEETGPLPSSALAHAFQEGTRLEVGPREVRYLAPSDIDSDPDVRVVFFKTSLNTGWDCPRAEVMMSFRKAEDPTPIAQLVGRMVRTPLARRIDADEHLNTVALYLPHYNEKELNAVVDKLKANDPDLMPPTQVVEGEETVTLRRAEGTEAIFAALDKLPSYTVPRVVKPNEVKRYLKMARLLNKHKLKQEAIDQATDTLIGVLRAEFDKVKDTEEFWDQVTERNTLDIRMVNHLLYESFDKGEVQQIAVSAENIQDIFEAAGKKLGEGLHKEWWRRRVNGEGAPSTQAKLEACVLSMNTTLKKRLETEAKEGVRRWFTIYGEQIKALSEAERQSYDEIRGLASEPELTPLVFPTALDGSKQGEAWEKHLYADGDGIFHDGKPPLNRWETLTVLAEMRRRDFLCWLRSVPRKPWALRIPYRSGENWKSVYPDFLSFRSAPDGSVIVDILDPHALNLSDAPAKVAGLAEFAEKHGSAFGRIESIIVSEDDEQIFRLDLQDPEIRAKARDVRTDEQVRRLFDGYAV